MSLRITIDLIKSSLNCNKILFTFSTVLHGHKERKESKLNDSKTPFIYTNVFVQTSGCDDDKVTRFSDRKIIQMSFIFVIAFISPFTKGKPGQIKAIK